MKKQLLILIAILVVHTGFAQNHYRNWSVKPTNKKERIALIIANNHYQSSGSLTQPIPMARKLKASLSSKGFDVSVGHDLTRVQMVNIIGDFSRKFGDYKFAMIFYLGHGFQIEGENYLIPIDANPSSKDDVEMEAINIDYVLRKVNNPNIPKIVVLDACRNNPFEKKWTYNDRAGAKNGFGSVSAPQNAEIFFTTQKNSKVLDNNPYLEYFMQELQRESCLDDIVRNVSRRIARNSDGQVPARYGQLFDEVCFGNNPKPRPAPNPAPNPAPRPIVRDVDTDGDGVYDKYDNCPNKYGPRSNNGCPKIKPAIVPTISYNKGKIFYDKRNYSEAKPFINDAAEHGHIAAQNMLGRMYKLGLGVRRDYVTATHWFQKAADSGLAEAQNNLGRMYNAGYGMAKDYEKAAFWYRKGAIQGNEYAQLNLGCMYRDGHGVAKDMSSARLWWKKACDQGNYTSCSHLKK